MAGETGEIGLRLVERLIVRGIGTLSLAGGVAFLIVGIRAIAIYLFMAGFALWLSSLRWGQRYQNIVDAPPEGYRPTGEIYSNPGGEGPVAVYFNGIRRIYVKARR